MKKPIIFIAFIFAASFAYAQDDVMTSKKGIAILPQEGDWGLGFDAAPFFKYVGNMFHGSDSTGSPHGDFTSNSPPMTIYGKKCITANKFYRAKLRLGFGSDKINYEVPDKPTADDTTKFNETYGADERTYSHLNINLSAGIEKRKGKGRVQGVYGAEAYIGFGNSKTTNKFHNALDSTMTALSTEITTFTAAVPVNDSYGPMVDPVSGKRINEVKYGSMFSFGVRGFIGVEYFFMAKASVGAEFGWGIGIATHGATETTTEYYESGLNPLSSKPGGPRAEVHANPGKNSSFGFDTDNAYGALNLFFYF
ncbi:MAG: hypothetical protein ABI855_08255 [Bacteroidota bacterium]